MPEVSDIWIKLNYWFLSYRKDLKRWWVVLLLAVDVFLVVFVVTNGVVAIISFRSADTMVEEIGTTRVAMATEKDRNTPKEITAVSLHTIEKTEGDDVHVITFSNSNSFWTAEKLFFTVKGSNSETQIRETFVIAQQDRVLLVSGDVGSNPEVVIQDTTWKRTALSTLLQVPLTYEQGQHRFITAQSQGAQRIVSLITSTVTNNSLYDISIYKGVVVARNGNSVVGAQQFFVENLTSRETRELRIQFLETLPAFTSLDFYSEIDILNPTILKI